MSEKSRIAELAATVAIHTAIVDNYIEEQKLPHPGFEATAPTEFHFPHDIEQSRMLVLEASQELNDLLQGPRDLLFNHHHNQLTYLKLISRFDLAKKVPIDGRVSYTDLAASAGVDESALRSVLRFGIACRVFQEPEPGFVAHTAASRLIAEDENMSAWVGAAVDEMWPAALNIPDALAKWPAASEPNQTGFSLAHQTPSSFYETLDGDPHRAQRFGRAMTFFTTGDGYALHHLATGYPWATLRSDNDAVLVVDVGGSHGAASFALAQAFPRLRCIVQDLPSVIATCRLPPEKPGLEVEFMPHDFFRPQPVRGADVYLLRWILHNWPDSYCIKILRALLPALKKGARVLVMDFVMPPVNAVPNGLERKLRAMDLTMLEIWNARERDLGEWKALLGGVHERLVVGRVLRPEGSRLALIETVWEG